MNIFIIIIIALCAFVTIGIIVFLLIELYKVQKDIIEMKGNRK
jgi:cell division protein FtsL